MHLQPVFGRSCTFQERGRDESPLGLWGKDEDGLVRCFLLSFRKGGQDTAGED